MKHVPLLLIWFRLACGIALLGMSLLPGAWLPAVAVTLFTAGLLSDVFDGIIARRTGVSTQLLRRLDSSVDQVFWLLVMTGLLLRFPPFFREHAVAIGCLLGAEALTYLISFVRFRKEVATHAITSKLWTLILFATLVQVMLTGTAGWLFTVCFYTGMLTRAEIIGILLILRQWTNDVPSIYHAVRIRQGRTIRRHKLFNG